MSEASKPWYVRKNIHAEGTAYVRDEKDYDIAFCQTVKDAERIVEAVNSHDALVAAIKAPVWFRVDCSNKPFSELSYRVHIFKGVPQGSFAECQSLKYPMSVTFPAITILKATSLNGV